MAMFQVRCVIPRPWFYKRTMNGFVAATEIITPVLIMSWGGSGSYFRRSRNAS